MGKIRKGAVIEDATTSQLKEESALRTGQMREGKYAAMKDAARTLEKEEYARSIR